MAISSLSRRDPRRRAAASSDSITQRRHNECIFSIPHFSRKNQGNPVSSSGFRDFAQCGSLNLAKKPVQLPDSPDTNRCCISRLTPATPTKQQNHRNRLPTGFDELDDIGVRADRRYLHDDAVLCLPIHTMRSSRNGIPD